MNLSRKYALWDVSDVFKREIGTYDTYDKALEKAKELDAVYNDMANYLEEKDLFYIAEEGLCPSQKKKLLRSDRYVKFQN